MKLLVTVGNAFQPFDRLLRMVEGALVSFPQPIEGICQIGFSNLTPPGLRAVRRLERAEFERCVEEADVVVSHGGVGAIATAVDHGHLPIVLARRADLGEHVNDHQRDVVRELAATGRLLDAEGGIGPSLLARARAARRRGRDATAPDLMPIAAEVDRSVPPVRWRTPWLELAARFGPRARRIR